MVPEKHLTEPLIPGETPEKNEKSNGDTWQDGTRTLHSEEGDVFDERAALVSPPHDEKSKMILEAKAQLGVAVPMVLVTVLQNLTWVISLIYMGHLGELELAAAAVATSMCSVTGNCVQIGLASGLETLCGQAYGARQYHMLGIYLQRALLVLALAALPTAVIWLNLESVLLFLGQDADIARLAGVYAFWLMPTLVSNGLLQAIVRFLQTQSVTTPMAVASAVALLVHIPANYLFIYTWGGGYKGAAMAISAVQWVNLSMVVTYVAISGVAKKTWRGFSWAALEGLGEFVKIAFPAATMICLEYWCFEIMTLLSGLLPNPKLQMSTLSICFNSAMLAYMIPYGLSAAASTRVSNALGAGNPYEAKRAAKVALLMSLTQACGCAVIQFSLRSVWGYMYTNEAEVISYVTYLIPFLVVSSFIDSLQAVISGVARGAGWQNIAAIVNLVAYYCVGLPLCVLLGFYFELSGPGLWMGLTCGLATQMVTLFAVLVRTNWQQTADEAVARVGSIQDLASIEKKDASANQGT